MSVFASLNEFFAKRSKKPWARFTTNGIDENGQVRFEMAWNKAFLKNIATYGFIYESPEIAVQEWHLASMIPANIYDEVQEEVVSNEHPNLQSENNKFYRG